MSSNLTDLATARGWPPFITGTEPACNPAVADLFYADERGNNDYGAAKKLCRRCPLVGPCRRWAVATGQRHGLWGGTTPGERGTARRHRPEES